MKAEYVSPKVLDDAGVKGEQVLDWEKHERGAEWKRKWLERRTKNASAVRQREKVSR